jgi:predicted metal-dependent hydrolase
MNIKISKEIITVGGVEVLVLHKDVKNLHLNVLPPNGKVRVSAPIGMSDDAIRTFVVSRISWIKNKRSSFQSQERQTSREYKSGESHFLFGRRYKLEVIESNEKSNVTLKGKTKIILSVRPKATIKQKETIMNKFYRMELEKKLEKLILKWQKKINVIPTFWSIRKMRTRWGTCDEETRRIWFNLELAKKPENCIQYVVVHELVHLLERKHDKYFVSLMDKYLPKWRSEKEELNKFILSHERWGN